MPMAAQGRIFHDALHLGCYGLRRAVNWRRATAAQARELNRRLAMSTPPLPEDLPSPAGIPQNTQLVEEATGRTVAHIDNGQWAAGPAPVAWYVDLRAKRGDRDA